MCTFLNGTAEEGEVIGSLHLAAYTFLDLLLEFGDFWTGFLHGFLLVIIDRGTLPLERHCGLDPQIEDSTESIS